MNFNSGLMKRFDFVAYVHQATMAGWPGFIMSDYMEMFIQDNFYKMR